jgi:hypothetical protein
MLLILQVQKGADHLHPQTEHANSGKSLFSIGY